MYDIVEDSFQIQDSKIQNSFIALHQTQYTVKSYKHKL